jgi:hypothetical protein
MLIGADCMHLLSHAPSLPASILLRTETPVGDTGQRVVKVSCFALPGYLGIRSLIITNLVLFLLFCTKS